MDLAFVERLVKDETGVKYLLVRQDWLYRIVDSETTETTESKETVRGFSTMIRTKNRIRKCLDRQGSRTCMRLQKNANLKERNLQCNEGDQSSIW